MAPEIHDQLDELARNQSSAWHDHVGAPVGLPVRRDKLSSTAEVRRVSESCVHCHCSKQNRSTCNRSRILSSRAP